MMELREASLLRVYFSEDDLHGEQPLYEALLSVAHEAGIAGTTVLRGVTGYGPSSLKERYFQLNTEGHPLVLEVIDSEEKVVAFLPKVEALVDTGAVTIERVRFAALAPR